MNQTSEQVSEMAVLREIVQRCTAAFQAEDPATDTCALATVDHDGRPSVRTVNYHVDEENGFVFFANTQSGKGAQLAANPAVSVCVHWTRLQTQLVIEGEAVALSDAVADSLWSLRDRDGQLAARVSSQGPAGDRPLEEKRQAVRQQFSFERIPRPPEWQGYLIRPRRVAVWPSGWHRLRDRQEFTRQADDVFRLDRFEP